MPGSRSSQRPWVCSMSSAPGAKTSKIRRPPGSSSAKAAASATRRSSSSSSQKGAKRADRELDTPPIGGRRRSPRRRSRLSATPASSARCRQTPSIPADESTPMTRIPSAAIGMATRPVPTQSSTTGGRAATPRRGRTPRPRRSRSTGRRAPRSCRTGSSPRELGSVSAHLCANFADSLELEGGSGRPQG